MSNFYKLRIKISKVEHFERDFDLLCDVLQKDKKEFVRSIEQNNDFCWVDDTDEVIINKADGCAYVPLYMNTYMIDEKFLSEFVEYFDDNYIVNLDIVFSYEEERNMSAGVYRSKITSFDVGTNGESEYDINGEAIFYSPKNDNQNHQMFLMGWNDCVCEGRDENDFFNQRGIDDSDFFVKNENSKYFEGDLPSFDDWLINFPFNKE